MLNKLGHWKRSEQWSARKIEELERRIERLERLVTPLERLYAD